MTSHQRAFIRELVAGSERSGAWRGFETFIDLATAALAANVRLNDREAHEAEYRRLAGKLEPADVERMARMMAIAVRGLSEPGDFLGPVAGDDKVRALNPHLGQFFTPFEVCRLMASLTFSDASSVVATQGFIRVMEPASGSGAMVLAAVAELQAQAVAPCDVWFTCADLSRLAVSMTFVQLSLAGVAAEVQERNSLTNDPPSRRLFTPAAEAFLCRHPYRERAEARTLPAVAGQMELFS